MNNDAGRGLYVWFDTEYSSLRLEDARILQLAVMITDHNLQRIIAPEEDLNLIIQIESGQPVSPWIREHLPHLVDACRSDGAISIEQADATICAFLDRVAGPASSTITKRPVLAGNSIHADWYLARSFLPEFLTRLHYRVLDVTSMKLIWQDTFHGAPFDKEDADKLRRYFPESNLAKGAALHDAYYDIQASVAELAYYREQLQQLERPPA